MPELATLARLVGDTEAFESVWGRSPHLVDASVTGGFADLLDAAAVDELLSTRGLRTPFLRVAKDGTTLANSAFTAGGGIGATVEDQVSDDKLAALFADGSTMVLQGLHRMWPPLVDFCQELAADLGHPVQCNAYVTPPQSQGFSAHYDVHDVFVLQLFGEKAWTVHAPVVETPLRSQTFDRYADAIRARTTEAPVVERTMRPGDCLYLPRGYVHSARALGGVSGHVTIGVHPWTHHALAEEIARATTKALAAAADARVALPVGIDVTSVDQLEPMIEKMQQAMGDALTKIPAATIAQGLAAHALSAQRAAPIRPLAQAAAARAVRSDSPVRLRHHLVVTKMAAPDGGVRLWSRAGTVIVPAAEKPAVDVVLAGEPVSADSLNLPPDLAISLVRRLLAAGVVVPVEAAPQ